MAEERKYVGIGVSPGIAVAAARIYRREVLAPERREISSDEAESEWRRFLCAKDAARRQLRAIGDSLVLEASGGEAGIMDAHLMVLDDEVIMDELRTEMFVKHHNAEWAVHDVALGYVTRFKAFGDETLSERADDISDVARRVMRHLMGLGAEIIPSMSDPCILVAEELTPSETLALPRDKIRGVVLARGGITSHAALLVRAIGIPAVFGLGEAARSISNGDIVAIDGSKGEAIVNPSEDETGFFRNRAAERDAFVASIAGRASEAALTPDGFKVSFLANIEDERGIAEVDRNGGEGVGLFRTEYLWMAEGRPMDEAAQAATYARVTREMRGRPVTIRLFDLGGDKFGGEGTQREANPFLGLRSIRYLLKHEAVCRIQLRAILRAGAETGAQINILVPMVAEMREMVRVRQLIEECVRDLAQNGVKCVPPKLGAMIEVPAAALLAPLLVHHADFFSVGTNDLTQYTLAVDRGNESAAYLYQPLHPAVLNLISKASEAALHAGIPFSVCGEMAGDPIQAAVLLGLRIDTFSMAPASIPLIKEMVRLIPLAEAQRMAASALDAATAAQVRHLSRDMLARFAPEILRQC